MGRWWAKLKSDLLRRKAYHNEAVNAYGADYNKYTKPPKSNYKWHQKPKWWKRQQVELLTGKMKIKNLAKQ